MSSHNNPAESDARRIAGFAARGREIDRKDRSTLGALTTAGGWGEDEAALLSELARRLAPHTESIVLEWTSRLVSQIDLPGADPDKTFEVVAGLNRHFLQSHLAQLELGDLESVLRTKLETDLELLRGQSSSDSDLRTTLLNVHLSIEISTAVICRWIQEIYADEPQLPLVIATYSRFALLLTKLAGEAFNEVRLGELDEALRVTSSLLDSSRELNTRSASVAEVLRKLNNIVTRVVSCERSVTYTWRESEQAYSVKDAVGFPDSELAQVRLYQFTPEMFPTTRIVHSGKTCSGTLDDGLVSRELMERHRLQTYALAPIIGSDGRPLGALAAYRTRPDIFTPTDIQILRGVAQNAGLAMENAVLIEELEVVSRLKGEFINSMSHEIRTPLNILFGYLEMLYDKHGSNDEDRHIFDRMRQNSHYVLKLVNTILDIGRIESGQMPVNITTFVSKLYSAISRRCSARRRSDRELPSRVPATPTSRR